MIVEGAFLKLPELLLGHSSPRRLYEATLTSHLAMGVLLELPARNIELPMHQIHIERSYPDKNLSKAPGRVDLYIDLSGVYTEGLWHELYGMKPDNWIEAKFFGGIGRNVGTQTKTTNSAVIALDLFRLCLFVQEWRSKYRNNARYFLMIFNRHPNEYLAIYRQSSDFPEREWLNRLLQPGDKQVHISLEREPLAFRKQFPAIIAESSSPLDMKLRAITREFCPIEAIKPNLYWGYLIRVIDFEISYGDKKLVSKMQAKIFGLKSKKKLNE